tara:strand:+ start:6312 stop:7166 length:855 start_codon:yes stop_codon:yes gene_type:complete
MRFIIDNYTTASSSQALYFAEHLNEMEEHEVRMLKQGQESIFDAFDRFKPDFYITSTGLLSKDAVVYISQSKNIKLIISTNDANNSDVVEIESALLDSKINCPFFISNLRDEKKPMTKKTKVIRFMECVDLNFDADVGVDYSIDKLVMVGSNTDSVRNYNGTFHVASHNQDMAKVVDVCLPINLMVSIISKYKEVIFQEIGDYLPQLFFHSIASGIPTYYDLEDKERSDIVDTMCDKVFGVGNKLNYTSSDKITDFDSLKELVLEKHTSTRRVKSLLSQLPTKK